jgi:membrane protein
LRGGRALRGGTARQRDGEHERHGEADGVLDLSAQQAYYYFFALFPAILFLISIGSFFPLYHLMDNVVGMLGRFAPPDVIQIVQEQMLKLSNRDSSGILTIAFLITIWSSSGAMVSIITTLNAAYDITESRPWWRIRATAVLLTIGLSLFILGSIFLVLAGPALAERIVANSAYLGTAFKWAWWILQWPVVFLLVVTGVGLVYYFAPDAEQDWVWITPGSVLATVLWLAVSLGLKFYIKFSGGYNETYGTIGGVMVLLLWFYLSGLALLLGAELNSEIEHASPYGKNPGERVPGEKRVIGARVQRLYEEKAKRGEIPVPPLPEHVNCEIDRPGAIEPPRTRASDLLIGTIALLPMAIAVGRKAKTDLQKKDDLKKTA